jgi:hypothetical protein
VSERQDIMKRRVRRVIDVEGAPRPTGIMPPAESEKRLRGNQLAQALQEAAALRRLQGAAPFVLPDIAEGDTYVIGGVTLEVVAEHEGIYHLNDGAKMDIYMTATQLAQHPHTRAL